MGFLVDNLVCFWREDVAISFRGDPPVDDGMSLEAFVDIGSLVESF